MKTSRSINLFKIIYQGVIISLWMFVMFFLIGLCIQFFGGVK